ncbi:hypothetical protein BCL57_000018 [Agromyces flavus]|uniref:Uncharacterized protein n=1 Tax=Agromyces flavus TaxID=589382 RepID=A0A1H1V8V6_9MICO|nr:hypothetical protein [Agromyces flavus]MCP2365876.1 hypothetical protein [Agromyces flavus]GGI43555.1 hypothetical protein GCM10010932_00180 [Agromyces flavus]SDS81178.1 hypothetical protein SAMN04489721_1948 [Agromyces flavus]
MPSSIDLILIGALLLALITVESGGWFLTRVVRGYAPANALQVSFFRAGHAHAAVLIVLSVAILTVVSAAALDGAWLWIARLGAPVAAILMPAGFFLSVLGRDPQRPGRAILLLWIGAASLAIGLATAGVGLIAAGVAAL